MWRGNSILKEDTVDFRKGMPGEGLLGIDRPAIRFCAGLLDRPAGESNNGEVVLAQLYLNGGFWSDWSSPTLAWPAWHVHSRPASPVPAHPGGRPGTCTSGRPARHLHFRPAGLAPAHPAGRPGTFTFRPASPAPAHPGDRPGTCTSGRPARHLHIRPAGPAPSPSGRPARHLQIRATGPAPAHSAGPSGTCKSGRPANPAPTQIPVSLARTQLAGQINFCASMSGPRCSRLQNSWHTPFFRCPV